MCALAEEFLLRHLNDGIGGFLLGLYIATVLFALHALCRYLLGGHFELTKKREIEKVEVDEIEKIPAPPFTPHWSLSLLSLFSTFYLSCLSTSFGAIGAI
jgi:hypothetical protein